MGDTRTIAVHSEHWQDAFSALDAAGIMTMLAGTHVRAVDATEAQVRAALGEVPAQLEVASATLEEAMVARERAA
ncbi:MAG: hypothetical protein NVV57_04110 [Demequina sp.]|nr:hypothetical protein [Demequina sp.]